MTKHSSEPISIFDMRIMKPALIGSLQKLDPRELWRNPVMLCVEIASFITLVTFVMSLTGANKEPAWFTGTVSLWLWLTVIFATFAEALAEGRGKARAASLRKSRTDITAKLISEPDFKSTFTTVGASQLHKGDLILVETGEMIAGDGDLTVIQDIGGDMADDEVVGRAHALQGRALLLVPERRAHGIATAGSPTASLVLLGT